MDKANKIEKFGDSYKYGVLEGESLTFDAFGLLQSIRRSYRLNNITTEVYLLRYRYPDFEHNPRVKLIEGEGYFYEEVQSFKKLKDEPVKDSVFKRIKRILF